MLLSVTLTLVFAGIGMTPQILYAVPPPLTALLIETVSVVDVPDTFAAKIESILLTWFALGVNAVQAVAVVVAEIMAELA